MTPEAPTSTPSTPSTTTAPTGRPEGAVSPDDYDAFYYTHYSSSPYAGDSDWWRQLFDRVASAIETTLAPSTVLDVGCAVGLLVGSLRARGIQARGIDVSSYAIENADPRAEGALSVASLTEPIEGRYDLVTCIEVIEHLEQADALRAIANICAVTDRVLLSSTPDDFDEGTHINVRPPSHWASLFADQGFLRRFDVDASFVSPQAVLFERGEVSGRRLVAEYETALWTLRTENLGTRAAVLKRDRQLAEADAELAASRARLEQVQSDVERVDERVAAARLDAERRIDKIKASRRYRVGSAIVTPLAWFRER